MGRVYEKWHICKCLVFHAENLVKVYTQKNSGYTKSRRKIRQQKIPKINSKFLHIEVLSREAWASKDTRFLTLSHTGLIQSACKGFPHFVGAPQSRTGWLSDSRLPPGQCEGTLYHSNRTISARPVPPLFPGKIKLPYNTAAFRFQQQFINLSNLLFIQDGRLQIFQISLPVPLNGIGAVGNHPPS